MGLRSRFRGRRNLVPPDRRSSLDAEGIVLLHPYVASSLRFENYRAPGVYSAWRRTRVGSALVVTRVRLAVYTAQGPFVNCTFEDPRFVAFEIDTDQHGLHLGFDPHVFDEQKSGRVDIIVRIPDADRALEWIQAERRAAGDPSAS